MAVSDGSAVLVYKELGLVAQVFDEATLSSMSATWRSATPATPRPASAPGRTPSPSSATSTPAAAWRSGHNGNLTNTSELAERVAAARPATAGLDGRDHRLRPHHHAARRPPDLSARRAALQVLPTLQGAFCLVFMDEHTLYAARDPHGVRPLVLGRLERGWVVASETAALDIVGASFVREVEPGRAAGDRRARRAQSALRRADAQGLPVRVRLPRPPGHHDRRPQSSTPTRVQVGRTLAFEAPVDADLVMPVPESGTPAAIGFAEQSGIPYGQGLVKNAYVGRTFIQPSQTIRQLGIRLKLNPLREVVKGKRLVVVDDSIVRGNTQRALVRMLREAGAAEVHVRISSPPVMWPCFYGIDFASRAELIASGLASRRSAPPSAPTRWRTSASTA
jgi:amidophosphoribosyltransferase